MLILEEVKSQAEKVKQEKGDLHSFHEGYGILMEEVEELFDEIKHRDQVLRRIRQEAIDVATVAVRIVEYVDSQTICEECKL